MAKEAFKRVSYKNRDILITLQFIIPSIAIMSIFILFPIIRAIIMAFQEWVLTMPSPTHPFIGLDNFREAFGLTHFPIMTVNTLVYTFCNVAGRMALGLGVALLLNQRFLGRSFVRGLMLIPWAMPTVVVTNVFRISLDPNYGLLNALVSKLPLSMVQSSFCKWSTCFRHYHLHKYLEKLSIRLTHATCSSSERSQGLL